MGTLVESFCGEILRWNQQINLVSRVSTEANLREMVRVCLDGAAAIPSALRALFPGSFPGRTDLGTPAGGKVRYFDIGSGAGLPGILWHAWLERRLRQGALGGGVGARSHALATYLFEPRERRAWFLARAVRQLGLQGVTVVNRRWGDLGAAGDCPGLPTSSVTGGGQEGHREDGVVWLVSLRALTLPDPDVITGWRQLTGMSRLGDQDQVAILRFRRPGFMLDEHELAKLGLPPGTGPAARAVGAANRSCVIPVGPEGSPTGSLLLSGYSGPGGLP